MHQFEKTSDLINEFFKPEKAQTDNLDKYLNGEIDERKAMYNVSESVELEGRTKFRSGITREDKRLLRDFKAKYEKAEKESGVSLQEFISRNKFEYLSLARRLKYARLLLNRNHIDWVNPSSAGRMPEFAKNWRDFNEISTGYRP